MHGGVREVATHFHQTLGVVHGVLGVLGHQVLCCSPHWWDVRLNQGRSCRSPGSPRGQSRSAKQTLCAVVSFFLRNSAAMLSTPLALLFDIFFIVSSISCSVRRRLIVAHSVLLSSMVSSSASTGPGFSLVQCCPLLFDLLALVMEDALCVFNLMRPHTGFLTIGFDNFP